MQDSEERVEYPGRDLDRFCNEIVFIPVNV